MMLDVSIASVQVSTQLHDVSWLVHDLRNLFLMINALSGAPDFCCEVLMHKVNKATWDRSVSTAIYFAVFYLYVSLGKEVPVECPCDCYP